jgi:hypothetical protein
MCDARIGSSNSRPAVRIDWVNKYLDYETLRRLVDVTLRTYAHELLHFLRWWESVHHTDEVTKDGLTESTLLDYVRFQSSQERELTGAIIKQRVAIVDRSLRIAFPGAPGQIAPALQSTYWQRAPMGIGNRQPRAPFCSRSTASHCRLLMSAHREFGLGLAFADSNFSDNGRISLIPYRRILDRRHRERIEGKSPKAIIRWSALY